MNSPKKRKKRSNSGDPEIVLASTSPRRIELLGKLGIQFRVVASGAAEWELSNTTPCETAKANAVFKAQSVACKHPDAIVIGADTVVALGTRLFGKPTDQADAARMLGALSGKTHEVLTAVCVIHQAEKKCEVLVDRTEVQFKRLSLTGIGRYLKKVHVLDKAGGYAIQECGTMIVKSIRGSFSNVVGFPVERVVPLLHQFGILTKKRG